LLPSLMNCSRGSRMTGNDTPDLLRIDRGLVVSPAGCGKTQLICEALKRHSGSKPILVLTHTNAGVAALRARLERARVTSSSYRLSTIDGWAIRLISTFPARSGHDPAILEGNRPNYPAIRTAALGLLRDAHVDDVIAASYSRLLIDEFQDCSIRQFAIVYFAARTLPTCVLGDPLQAIFGFGDDPLAKWQEHICTHFPLASELTHPWRWINAGSENLGRWLLDVRGRLLRREPIDLASAPPGVMHIQLDGSDDHRKRLHACRVNAPGEEGSVLIIGDSTSPASQRQYASQTPGAVTVEAVDLRDLVTFADNLDVSASDVLRQVAEFAQSVMTNVGVPELVQRVESLLKGTARKEPTAAERAALVMLRERTHGSVLDLLHELNKQSGTHVYRPAVLRSCFRALNMCVGTDPPDFREAAIRVREQNRLQGRRLPRRAVGSTLLLKGLEAEVAVILDADNLDARNLYVGMTRGSQRLVICSRDRVLTPAP